MEKIALKDLTRTLIINGVLYRVKARMFCNEIYGMGGFMGKTAWQFGSYSELHISPNPSGEVRVEIERLLMQEVNESDDDPTKIRDELEELITDSLIDWKSIIRDEVIADPKEIKAVLPRLRRFAIRALRYQPSERELSHKVFGLLYSTDPDNLSILVQFCGFLASTGDHEVAFRLMENYQSRIDLSSQSPQLVNKYCLLMAKINVRQGKYNQALIALNAAPDSGSALIASYKIQIYYYLQRYRDGISLFQTISTSPSESSAYWAAKCYSAVKDTEKAASVLRPFVRSDKIFKFLSRINGLPPELSSSLQARVVISSVAADRSWLLQFRTHFIPYARRGWVDVWDRSKSLPGVKAEEEMAVNFGKANAILILTSPDYLADDHEHERVLPMIIESMKRGAVVCRVSIRPSAVEQTEVFSAIPQLGDAEEPLSVLRTPHAEQRIERLVREFLARIGY